MAMSGSDDATKRLSSKKQVWSDWSCQYWVDFQPSSSSLQTLDDAYAAPANFLEIDVINPITHGVGNKRYTDYEVKMKVIERSIPIDDYHFNQLLLSFQTNLPVFRVKESSVRRRYSDFEWLRNELERDSKVSPVHVGQSRAEVYLLFHQIVVPPLPSKALKRQLPFRNDDGIYEEGFIEERRSGLEAFVNKWVEMVNQWFFLFYSPFPRIAGHPLAQNERCLHMFLQEPNIDRNYVPGKIRNT